MNETACAGMALEIPRCEKVSQVCRDSGDTDLCSLAAEVCTLGAGRWFSEGIVEGGWNPYDDRLKCEKPPLCGGLGMEELQRYLSLEEVQVALEVEGLDFVPVNMELNSRWTKAGDVFISTTRELSHILDKTVTNVLFVNGNNDIVV